MYQSTIGIRLPESIALHINDQQRRRRIANGTKRFAFITKHCEVALGKQDLLPTARTTRHAITSFGVDRHVAPAAA